MGLLGDFVPFPCSMDCTVSAVSIQGLMGQLEPADKARPNNGSGNCAKAPVGSDIPEISTLGMSLQIMDAERCVMIT